MNGLRQHTTVEQVARERGIEPSSLPYRSRAKSKEASHQSVAHAVPVGAGAASGAEETV
jgi:hypothetical protein